MYGTGIIKGLGVTLKHFVNTYVDDIRWMTRGGRYNNLDALKVRQSLQSSGVITVNYPEEKLPVPERFRFVPFLVSDVPSPGQLYGKDWCTSCGICAKVCPPQCIWIKRGTLPNGRPNPQPEEFYIDIDICMNCGLCAEYCPFDAIKMDHDYELASYDRTFAHIHDKERLTKPISYWREIAPSRALAEAELREADAAAKSKGKGGATREKRVAEAQERQATPATATAAPIGNMPPPPQLVEITDDMDPADIRKARIANSKATSAYKKELKAAGIDPRSVDI